MALAERFERRLLAVVTEALDGDLHVCGHANDTSQYEQLDGRKKKKKKIANRVNVHLSLIAADGEFYEQENA